MGFCKILVGTLQLALLFNLLGTSVAQPIYVSASAPAGGDGSSGNPFQTVGLAIALARTTTRTEIQIGAGYYNEGSLYPGGKTLSIIGASASTVTLDCTFANPFFNIANGADVITITTVTFSGCNGGAVLSRNGSSVVLDTVVIKSNSHSTKGAGVIVEGSTLRVINSVFDSNVGGSIFSRTATAPATVYVSGSRFYNNTGSDATLYPIGGILVEYNTNLTVTDSLFISNTRAIDTNSGSLNVQNCKFFDNDYFNSTNGTQPALRCTAIPVSQGSNSFCGTSGNVISCAGWTPSPSLVKFDGCGICNGDNSNKDCLGKCFGTATSCTHNTYYVKPGVTSGSGTKNSPFATIQEAVTACSSYGDTILLFEGSYGGPGNFRINFGGKTITLKSMLGVGDATIIRCNGTNPAFEFNSLESWDTIVQAVTVRNCTSVAAIDIRGSSPTLKDVIVQYNLKSRGAGVYFEDSFGIVDGCQIMNNIASLVGAGVLIDTAASNRISDVTIMNSRFANNNGVNAGAAIDVGQYSTVTVKNSTFASNTGSAGTGISVDYTTSKMNAFGNSFYSTNSAAATTIGCASAVPVSQSANSFCGSDSTGAAATCTGWGAITTAVVIDTCLVCNGNDGQKDCNGTCYGFQRPDGFGGCCHPRDRDCLGRCYGPALYDDFNTCCNSIALFDCENRCNGTKKRDNSTENVCCEPSTWDCADFCSGNHTTDTQGGCCYSNEKDLCGICFGLNACFATTHTSTGSTAGPAVTTHSGVSTTLSTTQGVPVPTTSPLQTSSAPVSLTLSGTTGDGGIIGSSSSTSHGGGITWLGFKLLYVLLVALAILIILILLAILTAVLVRRRHKSSSGGASKKVEMTKWY